MNHSPVIPTPMPKASESPFSIQHSWKVGLIVAAIMVLLALLGVALSTTTNPVTARVYWVSLVPIYGALCVATAWVRSRNAGGVSWSLVLRQVLHWLVIAFALALDFYIRGTGQETGVAAGLNALLLLALGCFLAGVHLDWLFALVGGLLTLTLICVTKADQYLWLIFVVGGIAVVAMLVVIRSLSGGHPPTSHAAPSVVPA